MTMRHLAAILAVGMLVWEPEGVKAFLLLRMSLPARTEDIP